MADSVLPNNALSETELNQNDDELQIATKTLESNDDLAIMTTTVASNDNFTLMNVSNLYNDSLSCDIVTNTQIIPIKQESISDTEVNVSYSLIEQSPNNKNIEKYFVGDIVWAKIGKYPFWPSVVCDDPSTEIYFKTNKKNKCLLHVRFCNDKGRRSWTTFFENYCSKCDLLLKYPNCLSYLKNNQKLMNSWNLAVEEANDLIKLDRDSRVDRFFKTFSFDSENLNASFITKTSGSTAAAFKVRTYSRKRSLISQDQAIDSKLIKTENTSLNGSISSRSIDIPLLSRSDDADSTVSDISTIYGPVENSNFKIKQVTSKKRRSTKTYPPKSSLADKYDSSDSMENCLEYIEEENLLLNNLKKFKTTSTASTSSRLIPEQRKLEISLLEGKRKKNKFSSPHSLLPSKKNCRRSKSDKDNNLNNNQNTDLILHSQRSKKVTTKKKSGGKRSLKRRRSTVKNESSSEPETTESEASSKNETYTTVFLASTKNKRLFKKSGKRACVVCKNCELTAKCSGTCQSFFHKECLAKSEERFKRDPILIDVKKELKRKRNYSKLTHKNENSIVSFSQNKNENKTNEENSDKMYNDTYDLLSKSPNGIKSPSSNQYSNHSKEDDELSDKLKNNDLSSNETNVFAENDEVEIVDKDLVLETTKEKPVKSTNTTNDKPSKVDINLMCSLCKTKPSKAICFVCGVKIEDPKQKIVCKLFNCGKNYHEKCLQDWPQCQWIQLSRNNVRNVICPHHVCHLCISDNPKSSCTTHFPAEKLTRCIKCPTAYHRSEYCLPAGSQVLTYYDIICSRHFVPTKNQMYHYNATWCFICTLGGNLVCCDLCPSSFHIECLNQNPSEFEGGFTCEECQTGRYPLYGEIVWVKIGTYRWWPAQIVFPNQVPDTVKAIEHSVGQFAVRFFGTYDYYWVNRGRVFNFHEGDDENILRKGTMKNIDHLFQEAIIEAAQAHNAYILDKDKNDAIVAKQSSSKPPKFTRIKFNKPFGNVKSIERGVTLMTPCECDPYKPNPCGPGSDCINRMLMFECHPQVCSAGDKCNNQRFEKVLYPQMEPFLTKDRGWGLKTLEDIKEGSFVIEYVGDVIDEEEYQKRCFEMHQRNEQNYYFLTIDNTRMIDAGPKGNLSRFMNHSCEPNCVAQKWTVNGDTRIGLFALQDIPAGAELVFNYRLQSCSGVEKKPCQCGATRCSKFIGVKVEEDKKKIIPINDTDKCKTATKNKRKPLKLKDNISDLDKSKSSKLIINDQFISITENEVIVDQIGNNSKNIASFEESVSTEIKKENTESSETNVSLKKNRKNSTRNSTNLTKNDNTINSSESENNSESSSKQRNCLSTSLKQLIKKNVIKTNLSLNKKLTKLKSTAALFLSKKEKSLTCVKTIEEMKTRKNLHNSTECKNLLKTKQDQDLLKHTNVIITEKPSEDNPNSRHSLTRLAKSRHLFLSKNDTEISKTFIKEKKKCTKEKNTITKITKTKLTKKEISLVEIDTEKPNKTNKHIIQNYCKNDSCLICGKGQTELACKNKKCPRVFHLSCINKNKIFKSGFICPSHFCSVCNKRRVVAKCKFCVESFCTTHVKGNIFKDPLGHGMLCTIHHPNKKSLPVPITSNISISSTKNSMNKNTECTNYSHPKLDISIKEEIFPDEDELNIDIDEIKDEYSLTQVIKDECDREYIHIGGFNVSNVSDLTIDRGETYSVPVDTDGDLFKPSSANVVIDIESASALYQSTDGLQLVSIATDNKDSNDYANIHFIPDVNLTKNKWLAAEP